MAKTKTKAKTKAKTKRKLTGAAAAAAKKKRAPAKTATRSARKPAAVAAIGAAKKAKAKPHAERLMDSPVVAVLGQMFAGLVGAALLDVAARAEGVESGGPVGPGTIIGLGVGAAGFSGMLNLSDSKTALSVGAGAVALPLLRMIDGPSRPAARVPQTDSDWLVLIEKQYGRNAAALVAQNAGYLAAPKHETAEPVAVPVGATAEKVA